MNLFELLSDLEATLASLTSSPSAHKTKGKPPTLEDVSPTILTLITALREAEETIIFYANRGNWTAITERHSTLIDAKDSEDLGTHIYGGKTARDWLAKYARGENETT